MSADILLVRCRQGKPHRLALAEVAWLCRPSPGGCVEVFLIDGQTLELEGTDADAVWAVFTPAASQTTNPDLPRECAPPGRGAGAARTGAQGMSTWTITDDTVWVLAPKDKVHKGERQVCDKESHYLVTQEVPGRGLGLLIFTDQEWAEEYISDANRQDMDILKMRDFLLTVSRYAEQFPQLTCLILDPMSGSTNVRIASIESLRQGRGQ
jgi:hypothetical protein